MKEITQAELRKKTRRALEQFISVELDLATTFCDIANTTADPAKAERNLDNARRAYESAQKFVEKMSKNDGTYSSEIQAKLDRLEPMLCNAQNHPTE